MIASLRGKVAHIDEKYAIFDVGGIGYKVFLASSTIQGLRNGRDKAIWTYMVVREDAMDLYGFDSKKEKDCFELLIGVSSIGPKSALNVLNLINVDDLIQAIRTGSTSHMVKVSGIGKKTAEKIVLELRDKLGAIESDGIAGKMSSDMDAIEALKSLGYDSDEAREALKKIDKEISDTGAKVKAALKVLS